MDSGANMFVAHARKYLHRFQRRNITVSLGAGNSGRFTGVGIMIATSKCAPGFLFLCYPTFLAPNDNCCTVSNGAFRKYAGFNEVLLDTWRPAHFKHRTGKNFSIPFTTVNSIDYISLDIHTTTALSRREEHTKSLQF